MDEMKDPDTRKLIFVNEDLKIKIVPCQGIGCTDLCGIWCSRYRCGGQRYDCWKKDARLYEVLDLGFGKCRMCVCGPKSAAEYLLNIRS